MGIPLRGPGGYILGTLCVIDYKSRKASKAETQILQDIAELVEDELGRQELRAVSVQLQKSTQKLASLINASPLAIISCDMEQRVDVWNPSAKQLFGHPPDDVVGRILGDINPALSNKLFELSRRAAQGELIRDVPIDLAMDDGSQKYLNLSVALLVDEENKHTGFTTIITDVTDRERQRRQTERERQLLDAVLDNVDAGVAACDQSGQLTVFNRTARTYIGDPVNLAPERWAEHYQAYDANGQHLLTLEQLPLYRALTGETVKNAEFTIRPQGKSERILLANGSAYGNSEDSLRGAVIVFHDITAQKALERELKHQATHDPLTGLPNRAALIEILSGAIARAKRSGEALAAVFLDLDGFKEINDTHGHQIGDQVLQIFSQRLKASVRNSDTVSRLSGDEFVVVLEQLKDPVADAQRVAEKILSANSAPLPIAGGLILTSSVRIALHREFGDPEELLGRADAAMYRAKQQGGSRVFIDDSSLGT
jgi:diguanylate cyclase (GGDEF)-like protein/PAS domain S-box-containing protein